MDGFDDLLGPSRAALEANPFADDPFSRPRSGSPDPWAPSPFGAADSADVFGNTSYFTTSDSFDSHVNAFETVAAAAATTTVTTTSQPEPTTSDPLDSAVALHHHLGDDDNESPAVNLRTPGFRESLPTTTATDMKPDALSEPLPQASLEDADKPYMRVDESETRKVVTQASSAAVVERSRILTSPESLTTPSKSNSSYASSQTPSSTLAFKSPLDPSASSILERSFTGLSIGGEVTGGWHTDEHVPWNTSETSVGAGSSQSPLQAADEDSDDDKPILQALQEKHQRDALVRLFFHLFLISY